MVVADLAEASLIFDAVVGATAGVLGMGDRVVWGIPVALVWY